MTAELIEDAGLDLDAHTLGVPPDVRAQRHQEHPGEGVATAPSYLKGCAPEEVMAAKAAQRRTSTHVAKRTHTSVVDAPPDDRTACQVFPHLFDSTKPEVHEWTSRACTACPLIEACTEYRDGLLAKRARLWGTWAGDLYTGQLQRRRGVHSPDELAKRRAAILETDELWTDEAARQARKRREQGATDPETIEGAKVWDRRRKRRKRAEARMLGSTEHEPGGS